MRILIKDTMIATMDEQDVIQNGYVLIEGDTIREAASGEYNGSIENTKVIDGSSYCVMPGLVNCHTHMAMTLLRGYGEGLPLMRWLNEKIWPMEARFTEEHIRIGTELAMLEMLRSGTTTVNDMYFMQDTVKLCADKFNVRAVLGYPIIGENWQEFLNSYLPSINKLNSERNAMCKAMLAPHSAYTLSFDALKAVAEAAVDIRCGIHIHLSETED
jgi:5-methylthioadenosine/S-adenosylhomocysteine deaminase